MTPEEVLLHAREQASEWLEMTDNPDALVAGILAKRIASLTGYVRFLEQRVYNHEWTKHRHRTGHPSMALPEKD